MAQTIFEALREDHQTQRTLCELLIKTHGDSEGRDELFEKLHAQLDCHASAEEKFFYTTLMSYDMTRDKSRHSVAEHKEIEDCIEELQEMEFSNPHWLPKAKELDHLVNHHLDEEEHEVFQLAGKAMTESEKTSLAPKYRQQMTEELAEWTPKG